MSDLPKERAPEADAPPPEPSSRDVSPAGIKAIQGLSEPPDATRPQLDTVHRLAPDEEVVTDVPPLGPGAANDLELAAQRADAAKATHYHNDSPESKLAEYRRLRSEISEEIAVQNITDGVRADAFSKGGTNFPNYDVLGKQEVSSVKVYSLEDGKPRFGAYREDFAGLVNPDSSLNRQAAERLLEIQASEPQTWDSLSPHLPDDVRAAETSVGMQAALAERATLRIPDDQVEAVRADLREAMMEQPARFGLDPKAQPRDRALQVEQMVQTQVLSIDDRYATAHYQAKAAELVGLRDLIVERRLARAE